MKNKIITLILCLSVIVPHVSFAQIPFGGRVVAVNECFCSGGWMIWVFDVSKKTVLPLVFQFGISRLNGNYNIYTTGVQTLGSYSLGGACTLASTACEVTLPAVGTISPFPLPGIGTSLTP